VTGEARAGVTEQRRRPGWWRRAGTGTRIGYAAAAVVTAVALTAGLTGYALYRHLNGNLHVAAIRGLTHRTDYGVQNILILGSQTRDGQGPGFGHDPGTSLSDNLLLVHLDATHTHAIITSVPRDTLVYEPACKSRFGNYTVPAIPDAIIDGAMNQGGPSCAVATVRLLTGVPIDHFVEFDFNSFRTMVDTVGGVEVCVPPGGYDDPYSNLHISGGKHVITGNEALAFVRTRHGVGNGGDLGRIQLQQEFFASLIQKLESQGTLEDPVRLFDIADTATRSLTVDPSLGSIAKLVSLAQTLKHLHARNVTFVTMPTVEDPANPNRLLPEQPQDDVLWQMVNADQEWPGQLAGPPAAETRVSVLNGTGIAGLAGRTAAGLRKLGFHVTSVGNAPATSTTTVSYRGSTQAGSAYTLVNALAGSPAVLAGGSAPVTLTIGSDFAGVHAPAAPRPRDGRSGRHSPAGQRSAAPPASAKPPGPQSGVETRNAAAGICSSLPAANPDPGTPP
jgi:LCP family protein required for cell wall assembly